MASAANGTIPNNVLSKAHPPDAYLKPLPDIDKTNVMGSQMDGHLLMAAAEAEPTANGRIVTSVPKSAFMVVYHSMVSAVNDTIPNNMFSKVNPFDAYLKPLPGTTAPRAKKAPDKMIAMDSQTEGNLLKAAAEAHHKAFSSVDAKSVTSTAPSSPPQQFKPCRSQVRQSAPQAGLEQVAQPSTSTNNVLTEARVVTGASTVTGVRPSGLAKTLAMQLP